MTEAYDLLERALYVQHSCGPIFKLAKCHVLREYYSLLPQEGSLMQGGLARGGCVVSYL